MNLTSRRLPMFPLGSVLIPTGVLPLHVFEMRYREMFDEVLKGDGVFGVVLITRGSEVGGGEHRSGVGTVARIVEHQFFDDGRLALIATGTGRVEVIDWLADTPFPQAQVIDLVDAPWVDDDALLFDLGVERLKSIYALSRSLQPDLEEDPSFAFDADPVTASWQLINAAPLGPLDKQRLLVQSAAGDRLSDLIESLTQLESDLRRAAELDDG